MPGAQCTRSLVCNGSKHTSVVTTGTPEITRHSPRNGFTAYSALSPATNSCLSPSSADYGFVCPVGPTSLREFNTSNGCQNDTASPYARSADHPARQLTAHEVHLALRL